MPHTGATEVVAPRSKNIRMTSNTDAAPHNPSTAANPWHDLTHYAALDWAQDHHDIIVVDARGTVVADFRIPHSAQGWQQLREKLSMFSTVAVAIETSQGPAVEQLVAAGFLVYPIHPKSAQRYRERKKPSGVKTDRIDAWAMADALRVDGAQWKPLLAEEALVSELRQLCRDETALIEQRTALVSQLRVTLEGYYPAALEAFEDWIKPSSWAFVERFPTPHALLKAGKRQWQKWLHANGLWFPALRERRLEIFARADALPSSPATVAAKSLLAVSLAKLLLTLETQLRAYRERIEALFAQHPDSAIFNSLPGAGPKLAPRLLAELGDNRQRFASAEGLQAYAGTAPLCFQSGQIRKALVRRACNHHLRQAVHLWAGVSIQFCTWAKLYYRQHRSRGKTHACALRSLGQRWLKILWKMWQTRSTYDSELHLRNQLQHGSWIIQLHPPPATKA
jgi:transposase